MLKRLVNVVLLFTIAPIIIYFAGCSKDEDPVKPPEEHKVNIKLRPGFFVYNRWDLDQANAKIDATKRNYTVELRGSGGNFIGAYSDWYYWIGQDAVTSQKTEMHIRVEPLNSDVMVYAFVDSVLAKFIALVPNTTEKPTIPPPQWDMIASYTGTAGTTSWNLHDATKYPDGIPLTFKIQGLPTPVSVTAKFIGKYESKNEVMTFNNKSVTTYKTSISVVLGILGTNYTEKIYFWFADDPSAQLKYMQESLQINLFGLINIPIPGEIQELISMS